MLDLSSCTSLIKEAEPFDKRLTKGSLVMLVESEIAAYARHVAAEVCGQRHVPGRRASDQAKADRIAALESEVARLQAALELSQALHAKDRRKHQEPLQVPDRRRGS